MAELVASGETELKTLIWNAYSDDGETMSELYTAARELIRKGGELQNSYDAQLPEELQWRVDENAKLVLLTESYSNAQK